METMQGNWYTPRLGSLLVKRDVVHVASTGAKFKLEPVKDCQVRLHSKGQSWLAEPIASAVELHWKPNDMSRAVVVWTREFTSLQGRWEASAFGTLTVAGSAVQYDSIASPFRLFYDAGQLALLDWRADFLETGDVRWTRQGQCEGPVIIWRPLREGLRMRRSGLRCAQRTPLRRSIAQVRNSLVQGPSRRLAKVMRSQFSRPHLPLSKEEKAELQMQLDRLDEGAFDDILEFLRPEVGSPQEDEIRLNVDTLSPRRQRALAARVRKSLRCQLRAVAGIHVEKCSRATSADEKSNAA